MSESATGYRTIISIRQAAKIFNKKQLDEILNIISLEISKPKILPTSLNGSAETKHTIVLNGSAETVTRGSAETTMPKELIEIIQTYLDYTPLLFNVSYSRLCSKKYHILGNGENMCYLCDRNNIAYVIADTQRNLINVSDRVPDNYMILCIYCGLELYQEIYYYDCSITTELEYEFKGGEFVGEFLRFNYNEHKNMYQYDVSCKCDTSDGVQYHIDYKKCIYDLNNKDEEINSASNNKHTNDTRISNEHSDASNNKHSDGSSNKQFNFDLEYALPPISFTRARYFSYVGYGDKEIEHEGTMDDEKYYQINGYNCDLCNGYDKRYSLIDSRGCSRTHCYYLNTIWVILCDKCSPSYIGTEKRGYHNYHMSDDDELECKYRCGEHKPDVLFMMIYKCIKSL